MQDLILNELDAIKRKLYAQELIERLRIEGKQPRFYPEFRSQFGEDMVAWSMLDHATYGTYVTTNCTGYWLAIASTDAKTIKLSRGL
jgi:hypothetical protein